MPGSLTTLSRPSARVGAPDVLPSTVGNASASQVNVVFEAQWLAYALPYRRFAPAFADDGARLGPMWLATPSSQWTFTTYSLPVSRRTPTLRRSLIRATLAIPPINVHETTRRKRSRSRCD